jgi:hypothetical protein
MNVRFEVLTAVVINVAFFWDIAPFSPYVKRRFGGTCHLSSFAYPAATHWFLALLIFDPEDGIDTFLRNVGSHTDYAALYPRRWEHSFCMKVLPLY